MEGIKTIPELKTEEHKSYYDVLQKGLETLLKIYPLTPENSFKR